MDRLRLLFLFLFCLISCQPPVDETNARTMAKAGAPSLSADVTPVPAGQASPRTAAPSPASKQGPGSADGSATQVVPQPAADASPPPAANPSFTAGLNVAWVNFAADIGTGHSDIPALRAQFAALQAAGGKVARVWLHTDGTVTPAFTDTAVTGPGPEALSDLQQILDAAHAEGVQVMLTLWSFDMVRAELKAKRPEVIVRNRLLLTDSGALGAYLDTALTPMVQAFKDHPALYAWDVINEPEGMTEKEGWSTVDAQDRVSNLQIQAFINMVAGRIHKLAPKDLVTSGAVSFRYLSPTVGLGNYYADSALIKAGGDPLGTLDFYQVHHYDSIGKTFSPFLHSAASFGADKPVLVGEFAMQEYLEHGVDSPRLLYAKLQALGYSGALGWKDDRMKSMNLMLNSIAYLRTPADLTDDPNLCSHFTGGFGQPFYDGSTLYRMQTATAAAGDKTLRCSVQ